MKKRNAFALNSGISGATLLLAGWFWARVRAAKLIGTCTATASPRFCNASKNVAAILSQSAAG